MSEQINLEIVNASVVVTAETHNPTLLHHTFLKVNKIVPADWEPDEEPVCTPPFAIVKYMGRFVFTAEINKITFVDNLPPENMEDSEIIGVSSKYITTLPHVNYQAMSHALLKKARQAWLGFEARRPL